MRFILLIAIVFSIIAPSFSQTVHLNDTLDIEGHEIVALEGQLSYGEFNAITYHNQQEILAELKQVAKDEMWDQATLKEQLNYTTTYQKGGQLVVRVGRITIESANTKWFTVIVKKGETEILRKQLKDKIAKVPSSGSDIWTNLTVVSIPKAVAFPIDVYLIEAGGDPPKFRFRILN
jgi:hypothetical protein